MRGKTNVRWGSSSVAIAIVLLSGRAPESCWPSARAAVVALETSSARLADAASLRENEEREGDVWQ